MHYYLSVLGLLLQRCLHSLDVRCDFLKRPAADAGREQRIHHSHLTNHAV